MSADGSDGHSDETRDNGAPVVVETGVSADEVADSAASKAETDDHDYWSDDDWREKFVEPFGAKSFDQSGNNAVDDADHKHADRKDPKVDLSDVDGISAGNIFDSLKNAFIIGKRTDFDSGAHRGDISEGRGKEHWGLAFGDKEIEKGADTSGEKGRGDH